jgi:hypothetical protein
MGQRLAVSWDAVRGQFTISPRAVSPRYLAKVINHLAFSFVSSDFHERRHDKLVPRTHSALYSFHSPTIALDINLAAERSQSDLLFDKSFRILAVWRLLPR